MIREQHRAQDVGVLDRCSEFHTLRNAIHGRGLALEIVFPEPCILRSNELTFESLSMFHFSDRKKEVGYE